MNGTKYAFNVVVAALKARLQDAGLFYDRKFDCAPADTLPYVPKFSYTSPHSLAFERIRPGVARARYRMRGRVYGSLSGEQKQCRVDGIDSFPIVERGLDSFLSSRPQLRAAVRSISKSTTMC